jgi:hypothetical protein
VPVRFKNAFLTGGRLANEGLKMMVRAKLYAVATIVATATTFSSLTLAADTDKARLSHVMWSAFQCSALAEMSGDKNEQARLFQVGLKAGRDFLEAAKNGEITPRGCQQRCSRVAFRSKHRFHCRQDFPGRRKRR